MFVGRHVCCAVCVMRHFILTLPFVALVSGHPRPSVVSAPVHRGCPCRDKKGRMTHPGDEPPKRQPLWLCRVSGHCHRGHDCRVDLSCGRRSHTHCSSKYTDNKLLSVSIQTPWCFLKWWFLKVGPSLYHTPKSIKRAPTKQKNPTREKSQA